MKLLIGGSPCTNWSIAQTKNRETEPEGMGWELFKNYLIALEKFKPDFFLYENNKSMAPAIRAQITKELGVEPILINSALVSAQNRQRLYWTNIPGVEQPEDLGILLRDILESGIVWKEKAYCLAANRGGHSLAHDIEKSKYDYVAEPVNVTTDGKSVTLCGQGGGVGAKTGLYAAPVRVGDMPNADGIIRGGQAHRVYDADGKAVTLTARPNGGGVDGPLYAVPTGMAWRGRGESSSYEMRDDQKANAVTADGHQSRLVIEAADGKTYPVYEVRDGQITIKGKQYPIKLADGFYIIRKLTVTECKRLQTVPEEYIFPVSDTKAYKMLGNGWTVDVIAHILHYAPGITEEPLEILSMYDGMSCGRLALNKLGAHISHYYATEIDKYAVKTTQHNFPDTIQLGDAFQVRDDGWSLPGLVVEDKHKAAPLEIVPMTLREANAYVEQHHWHHGPVAGQKYSIGLSDGEKIVGVAIVGRPVSRRLDDGWTLEVNRLCTDGTKNACSMLYAAGGPWGGQVCDPVRLPVPGDREPRRGVPGASAGGTAPDNHRKTRLWCGQSGHGAADYAQQPERGGHIHHRSGEHDNRDRSGRPPNADHTNAGSHWTDGRRGSLPERGGANTHPGFKGGGVRGVPGHDPVSHRTDRAGPGPGRDRSNYDH